MRTTIHNPSPLTFNEDDDALRLGVVVTDAVVHGARVGTRVQGVHRGQGHHTTIVVVMTFYFDGIVFEVLERPGHHVCRSHEGH